MKATYLLRRNIEALLQARKETQTSLAFAIGHKKSWINKFLNGTRQLQLKDLDRIADFFGLATYQLFQPGISSLTERRKLKDRRSGQDRRISRAQREMISVTGEIEKLRPRLR